MDNNNSPAPYRIVGNYAGQPIMLRSYADRVTLTFKGMEKSFPNCDAAMFFLKSITQPKHKGGKAYDYAK